MDAFSAFLVRHRYLMFGATLAITIAAAYLASTLKMYDDPNRWPPKDDPSVVLNEELQLKFGGANLVTIMVSRNDGETIVQPETLLCWKTNSRIGR